ncbi:hypothetical protein LTS18_013720, partial [Coniosporium uncinatum]
MNWTGGRLQRHSKKSTNSIIDRQKQHFAKVRTRLHNGSSPFVAPPFRPSFLSNSKGVLDGRIAPFGRDSQRPLGHSSRQRKLEEFDTIADVAERLSSMRPRDKQHQHEKAAGPRFERATSPSHDRKVPEHPSKSRQLIYPLHQKRKRLEESKEEVALLEARRQLLLKSDWVGLAPSRPVQIQFNARRNRDQFAKRRKVDKDAYTRRAVRQRNQLQVFQEGNDRVQGYFMSGAIVNDPNDIRIRIGSEVLASQVSEAEKLDTIVRSASGGSSDAMLLDIEGGCQLSTAESQDSERGNCIYKAEVTGSHGVERPQYESSELDERLRNPQHYLLQTVVDPELDSHHKQDDDAGVSGYGMVEKQADTSLEPQYETVDDQELLSPGQDAMAWIIKDSAWKKLLDLTSGSSRSFDVGPFRNNADKNWHNPDLEDETVSQQGSYGRSTNAAT